MDLQKVFAEIDSNTSLSEQQKLDRKAKATKAWRQIHGIPETREYHHKNKTSMGGTFGRSVARTLGSQLIRALFRGFR